MTWWEVHTHAQEKLHAAFTVDAKAKIKEMKEARKAVQEAKKLADELAQEAKKLSGELAASAQQIQDAKTQSGNLAASQQQTLSDKIAADKKRMMASQHYQVERAKAVADTAKYKELLKKIGQAEQATQASLNNGLGRLLNQMGGPLGAAGAKQGSLRFNAFKTLLGILNGTPNVGLQLLGTAKEVGKAFVSRFVEGAGKFGWGVFSEMVSGLPEKKVSAKLPGMMDCKLLLKGMLLEAFTPAFREAYAKLVAGLLDVLGEDLVGTLADLWRIDETYIKDVARLRQLRSEEERLRKEAENSSKSADRKKEAWDKAREEKDALTKSYHDEKAKHDKARESYREEIAKRDKIQKDINETQRKISKRHEEIKAQQRSVAQASVNARAKWKVTERVLLGLSSHGWPVLNTALAGWCYWSLKDALEKLGEQLGPESAQYKQAADTLLASKLVLGAAFVELSYKALGTQVAARNLTWAPALTKSMVTQIGVRVVGTVASTISSAVFGYWDFQKMKVAQERGHEGWERVYRASVVLAGASVVFGLASLFAFWLVPWAVGFALVYAAFSFIVSKFEPPPMKTWLMSCYLGISPSEYDEADKKDNDLEMNAYALLGFERIAEI